MVRLVSWVTYRPLLWGPCPGLSVEKISMLPSELNAVVLSVEKISMLPSELNAVVGLAIR